MDSILKKKLNLPYYLSPDAKDLLSRLLRKNPNVRLGSGEAGVRAIKSHRFFRKVDWNKLEKKETEPPIVPVVVSRKDRSRRFFIIENTKTRSFQLSKTRQHANTILSILYLFPTDFP